MFAVFIQNYLPAEDHEVLVFKSVEVIAGRYSACALIFVKQKNPQENLRKILYNIIAYTYICFKNDIYVAYFALQ